MKLNVSLTCFVSALAACVTFLVAPSAQAVPVNQYVALGDSYSSGVGADVYKLGFNAGNINMSTYEGASVANECFRNQYAYPRQVATAKSLNLKFVACSGATISNIFNGRGGEPPQLDALSSDTKLVTLTAGGNDAGFMDVMGCIIGQLNPLAVCKQTDPAVTNAMSLIATVLPSRYDNLLSAIKSRAPSAQIIMLGYATTLPNQVASEPYMTVQERQIALNLRNSLNTAIQAAADRAGVTYVDPFRAGSPFNKLDASADNVTSTSATWAVRTEFAFPNFWSSYHPTRKGHDYASDMILRVVRR